MKEIAIFIWAAIFIFFVVKAAVYIIVRLKNAACEKSAENARVCSEPYVQPAWMNARMLGNELHSVLKAAGFKRRSSTWNRVRGNFVDVVNLQRSRWSASVILNVSVVIPWICNMKWGEEDRAFFTEELGLAQVRFGDLRAQGEGWLDMEDGEISSKLIAVLNERVFPYFDSLPDYASLAKHITEQISKTIPKWAAHYPFHGINSELALLAYLQGEQDRARVMFETIFQRGPESNLQWDRKIYCRVFGKEEVRKG